jgi:LysM domain
MSFTIDSLRATDHRALALRIMWTLVFVGLVAGAPLALVGADAVPSLTGVGKLVAHPSQVGQLLGKHFGDRATADLVWSIAWLSWGWFVICVCMEILGRLRGRPPGRMPGSRHVQSLVTWLVGACLAFGLPNRQITPLRLQVVSASAPSVSNPPLTAVPRYTQNPQSTMIEVGNGSGAGTSNTTVESPQRIYVVKPRDTLWSIANAELGNPLAWRLIAAANYGRLQPDGQELIDDHWIRPGWRLVIPTSGTGVAPAAEPTSLTVPSGHVEPTPATKVVSVPSLPGTSASSQAILDSPMIRGDDPNRPAFASIPSRSLESRKEPPGPHVPAAPIGYGLLGAGIVALLDRMRRAQQRNRASGLRIALPEGDLAELERGLRIAADPGSADWVDFTLRLLSVCRRRGDLETPTISALLLRDDVVQIVLDPTCPCATPPPPFEAGPDDTSWTLAKSGQRIEELRKNPEVVGIDAPLPSLVTLGREEAGILMVNIESAGSVAISGADNDSLIQAIAIELATAQWADQIDLVLVGFGDEVEGLERVSHAVSVSTVSAKMKRRVQERRALLASVALATNSESRWRDGGDAWDLSIVVCSPGASADQLTALDELIGVVGDGSFGVAVICGHDVPSARWRVRAEAGGVSVDGESLKRSSLSLQSVPPEFFQGVADLVSVAAQTSGVTPDHEPYGSLTLPIPERRVEAVGSLLEPVVNRNTSIRIPAIPQPSLSDEPKVLVRVLGQVAITGAARQFTRAWAMELIVYLALHPGGASNEQWATALWPERVMAPASLHSTASAARRSSAIAWPVGTRAPCRDGLGQFRGSLSISSS